MFSVCRLLSSIPDISKWNITNLYNMSNLLSECSSLVSIPDIFKFKGKDIIYISDIFRNCYSLISLPNIIFKSKYSTKRLCWDSNNMFSNCLSLISFLPLFIKHQVTEFHEGSGVNYLVMEENMLPILDIPLNNYF